MYKTTCFLSMATLVLSLNVDAKSNNASPVDDDVIATQRHNLGVNTIDKSIGPQSPRNIDSAAGNNIPQFNAAPTHSEMNLCNIHFHKNAEHAGGQFSTYSGNGDGQGFRTGYLYSGKLTDNERRNVTSEVCPGKHGGLQAGDTVEIHYVHSSAQVKPGPTLKACFSESGGTPKLRVEAQVYVLVADSTALDFTKLTSVSKTNGFYQALNIPNNTGKPVVYSGSTTGPSYNEVASLSKVTWSVRPEVVKVNIDTVGKWCEGNDFDETYAHGVRNLVTNLDLLSPIK